MSAPIAPHIRPLLTRKHPPCGTNVSGTTGYKARAPRAKPTAAPFQIESPRRAIVRTGPGVNDYPVIASRVSVSAPIGPLTSTPVLRSVTKTVSRIPA